MSYSDNHNVPDRIPSHLHLRFHRIYMEIRLPAKEWVNIFRHVTITALP